jgi:capsid protein
MSTSSSISGPTLSGESIWGYEGAQISNLRSAFFFFPTNSRREFASYTRKELVRKARALDANLGIVGRIARKIAQHSVGKGIFPRPLTRDKAWNDSNRKRFERKVSNPYSYSIDSSRDLWEDQRLAAETMVGDGEFFEAMVKSDIDGTPMVQPLDVFEIADDRQNPNELWHDGVLLDSYDRPTFYGVRELPIGKKAPAPRRVPADSMIHLFRRRRARQPRGFTWFYSGINDGIDVLDTKALIKGTAKLHSTLALQVKRKKAEGAKTGISGALQKIVNPDGTTRVNENFFGGAAIAYLAEDEGIELINSDRPGENLMAFMEFLYREFALGADLPLEVVYNMAKLGGPAVRAVLESAQWLFDLVQDSIVMRHSQRIYVWDTADAMMRGEQPMCNDPEWWVTAWRGPAKLTVDMGRTADAAVLLMKNAALSHVRYYEERAQDAYEEAEEQIEFLSWLKERCTQAGVDFSLLIEPTPGAVTKHNVTVNADGNQDQ